METWYDKEEDVFNIQLEDKEYWKSLELNGVVLDLAKDGSVMSVEIHKASRVFSGDTKKVLEKAKMAVKE
ncbi:DUF2283 domain-containing protein [Candidatus Woesearchaeota archaeon]|nr:DUF2283 domain-containing protein [Candidatus Woesearchaeota archaeon]